MFESSGESIRYPNVAVRRERSLGFLNETIRYCEWKQAADKKRGFLEGKDR